MIIKARKILKSNLKNMNVEEHYDDSDDSDILISF